MSRGGQRLPSATLVEAGSTKWLAHVFREFVASLKACRAAASSTQSVSSRISATAEKRRNLRSRPRRSCAASVPAPPPDSSLLSLLTVRQLHAGTVLSMTIAIALIAFPTLVLIAEAISTLLGKKVWQPPEERVPGKLSALAAMTTLADYEE